MRLRAAGTLVLAAGWLCACASAGGRTAGSIQGNVITRQDLVNTPWNTAYDVLAHNRLVVVGPEDIKLSATRGETSFGSAGGGQAMLLVLDGSEISSGVVDILRSLTVGAVQKIEILRPYEAASHYGTAAQNGVLVIQTRHGG